MTQMLVYTRFGYAQRLGYLLVAQPAAETQLHHSPACLREIVGHG